MNSILKKETDYLLFNIGYPEAIIRDISANSPPEFAAFIKKWKEEKSPAMTKSAWASRELIHIAQSILMAPYGGSLLNYFYGQKIREFLFHLYVQYSGGAVTPNIIDAVTRKKISFIAKLLKTRLTHYFPVPELARKVNMTGK